MSLFHSSMWMWIEIMLSDVFSDSDISVKLVKREQEGSSQLWGGGGMYSGKYQPFFVCVFKPSFILTDHAIS